jgi:Zinc carboxypeptidase
MKVKIFAIAFMFSVGLFAQNQDWKTYYEKSNFKATPDYAETISFFKRMADTSPWIDYSVFGVSPQGRDLPLLVIDKNENFSAEEIRKTGNAILFIEAGIHSGEIEGKDAMMLLLRELVFENKNTHLLDHVSIVFIPIFNVDGHERSGPYNRINQNGPENMGWRCTAQNLNLNRDFLKADAPEMKAWLKLYNGWLPDFFMDIHTTDGADYQYPLTYQMELCGNMDPGLTALAEDAYLPQMKKQMARAGMPAFQYVAFRTWFDPTTGLRNSVAGPRYSQGYTAIQNRPGLLVETHMLKPYKVRVDATLELIKVTLGILDKDYKKLIQLNQDADAYAASQEFRDEVFNLSWRRSDEDSIMVDFKGVEYKTIESDLTGGPWHLYDSTKKKDYTLPYFYKMQVTDSARLPEAYIFAPQWLDVIELLDLHGIDYFRLKKAETVQVENYTFKNPAWRTSSYEGRFPMNNIEFDVSENEIEYPAKSIVVPMNQRTARVIANLFEPKGEDSFVYWGFFNSIFEQKEYAETYVMEKEARKMIKKNPDLLEEFKQWKKDNPEVAQNQWVQLNWFYQRSPWWDQQMNIYPVGRICKPAELMKLKQ